MTCDFCGKDVESLVEVGNMEVCEECSSSTRECFNCNVDFPADALEYIGDGRYVCSECKEDYEECGDCGRVEHRHNMCAARGSYYCEGCFGDRFFHCSDCGTLIDSRNDNYGENNDGDILCDECLYRDDSEGVHEWDYKPRAEYHTLTKKKPDDLFLGIELETEFGPDCARGEIIDVASSNSYYYLKHDGSLEDGVEIVSHPATFEWITYNFDSTWKKILNLRSEGLLSYTPGTCGIHVHMSRSAFSPYHLYKFQKFFYCNKKLIRLVAQRDLRRWASIGGGEENYIVAKASGKTTSEKYTAVNINGGKTVEIRIFTGTLKESSFKKNYEFCHAAYMYTKQESAAMLTGARFLEFVRANKKTYPNLLEFMENKFSEDKHEPNTIKEVKYSILSDPSFFCPSGAPDRWVITTGVSEIDMNTPVSV